MSRQARRNHPRTSPAKIIALHPLTTANSSQFR